MASGQLFEDFTVRRAAIHGSTHRLGDFRRGNGTGTQLSEVTLGSL